MRLSPFRRAAVLSLTALSLAGTSGCFGSFNLTRKVYGFNRTVSNDKFVREIVFLGLVIVPVYSIAAFLDAVVVNSVEFWTGKNPVTMSNRMQLDGTTNVQTVMFEKDGVRMMTLKAFEAGKLTSTTTIRHLPGSDNMEFRTVFADGRTIENTVSVNAEGKAFFVAGR